MAGQIEFTNIYIYIVFAWQGSSLVAEAWQILHSTAGQIEYVNSLARSLQDLIHYAIDLEIRGSTEHTYYNVTSSQDEEDIVVKLVRHKQINAICISKSTNKHNKQINTSYIMSQTNKRYVYQMEVCLKLYSVSIIGQIWVVNVLCVYLFATYNWYRSIPNNLQKIILNLSCHHV